MGCARSMMDCTDFIFLYLAEARGWSVQDRRHEQNPPSAHGCLSVCWGKLFRKRPGEEFLTMMGKLCVEGSDELDWI